MVKDAARRASRSDFISLFLRYSRDKLRLKWNHIMKVWSLQYGLIELSLHDGKVNIVSMCTINALIVLKHCTSIM